MINSHASKEAPSGAAVPVSENDKRAQASDFYWGISGHSYYFDAYRKETLEQQILLAAQLGTDIYRLNFTPALDDAAQLAYLDEVLRLCDENGLKLFLIIYDWELTEKEECESVYRYCKALAKKYRGRIPYYQLSNEQDIRCMKEDSTGERRRNFDLDYTKAVYDRMSAMQRGIKEGDCCAKTSVNISYKHSYFMNLLLEYGMEWDISGLDWYSDMGDPTPTMDNLISFPAEYIFVSEINRWGGNQGNGDREQCDYISEMAEYFRKYERVKAFMIYELLDEPVLSGVETSFGLVKCHKNGIIGDKKPAFDYYRKLICKSKAKYNA